MQVCSLIRQNLICFLSTFKLQFFSHTPFALSDTDSPKTILERIGKGEFEMNGRLWESISSNAKELIKLMLDVDPRCVTICLFVGLSVLPSCFFKYCSCLSALYL